MFGRPRRAPGPVVRMLQDHDPHVRMRAVTILGGRHRPRAAWLLQRVYRNDPNPQVRKLAKRYLEHWAQAMLNGLTVVPEDAASNEKLWECEFCGTKDVKGGACPNCGAPRPDDEDED
ncbi:MAG TPA: HEAT repeat domain-containing protein [Aggregatilineales bacterium]|nr:HEAT repeat domain-containing protein [Aggregatilineales bacterium]